MDKKKRLKLALAFTTAIGVVGYTGSTIASPKLYVSPHAGITLEFGKHAPKTYYPSTTIRSGNSKAIRHARQEERLNNSHIRQDERADIRHARQDAKHVGNHAQRHETLAYNHTKRHESLAYTHQRQHKNSVKRYYNQYGH